MVTATVQCKRHQREGSDGKGDVLNTPHPPGGQGWSLGAHGAPGAPSGNATKCQCLAAPLGCPSAVPAQPEHPPLSPGLLSPGMRWAGTSGIMREGGNGVGMLHLAWIPQILPLATQSRDRGSWSSAPCWEGRRRRKRRMPRPGWHRGPVQSWHWLAEGP